MEWMTYADGPGSSKRRTVQTMAEERHPHHAMSMRRLDHVDAFNEQGVRRGRWITLAALEQSETIQLMGICRCRGCWLAGIDGVVAVVVIGGSQHVMLSQPMRILFLIAGVAMSLSRSRRHHPL